MALWLPQPPVRSSLFLTGSHSCPPLCKKHAQAGARGNLLLSGVCSTPSSSSSSSSVVTKREEEEEDAAASPSQEVMVSFRDDPNFRGCKGCGRDQVERGCNGEGRIQGGIAAVWGFGWWPIKAYRPCPGFVASGGRYRRQGQSMDDVASGRGKKKISSSSSAKNTKT